MIGSVLVTGGAGFIGSHVVERLLEGGHEVTVLDNLSPQVHGPNAELPDCLKGRVKFIKGDIRDRSAVEEALSGVDGVIHLAAETGVGQSMYRVAQYMDVNVKGSGVLLDAITDGKSVEKIIVASSRSVYGEGKYQCGNCGVVYPEARPEEELKRRQWEILCPTCAGSIKPMPTDEESLLRPRSIYAITKQVQEQMFLLVGRVYQVPTVVLRYFNVYGPRQSLNNPYTGILSIFATRIMNGRAPLIFEDGLESRDFVHVRDAATATVLALEKSQADYQTLNVGSGERTTVMEVADLLVEELGGPRRPTIVGKYRVGDIRHCHADLVKASSRLAYDPGYSLAEGVSDFVAWVREQKKVRDLSDNADRELADRRLLRQV